MFSPCAGTVTLHRDRRIREPKLKGRLFIHDRFFNVSNRLLRLWKQQILTCTKHFALIAVSLWM